MASSETPSASRTGNLRGAAEWCRSEPSNEHIKSLYGITPGSVANLKQREQRKSARE
jgi:hypothetical protein